MPDTAASTPLMEQYERVKAAYPGHLVLFRVGDFFEAFGEEAGRLARELDLTLTARSADAQGVRTPMAGVPQHALESYLGRLVDRGYKVAVCDQVEDARFAKGLVRREVTRVVTPGTVLDPALLPGPESNFLVAAVVPRSGPARFAAVDVSTGEWHRGLARHPGPEGLVAALAPFGPREAVLAVEGPIDGWAAVERALRHEFPRIRIEAAPAPAEPELLPKGLAPGLSAEATEADRRLAAYVRAAQPRLLPSLELVSEGEGVARLALDAKTLRHLEIARPMNPDDPAGPTLLKAWDATVTAPGRRTLSFWLKNPLADVDRIVARQDAVERLVGLGAELLAWRRDLAQIGDIARIAARLAARRLRPIELSTLVASLAGVAAVRARLARPASPPRALAALGRSLGPIPELTTLLATALPEEPPGPSEERLRFRPGFAPRLDELRTQEAAGLEALAALERSEQAASGIRSLKIGYNQVFGYYFEVSRPNLGRVPAHLRRKQTLSGGERFTSDALETVEGGILRAREEIERASAEAWEGLLARIDAHVPALHRLARAVGELDALASFAQVAIERGHVRPQVDDSPQILLREARHPVLDRTLAGRFVPNDTELDGAGGRLLVLTGPNMSGKSTYMRQVGLIVVLAQAGAFVPARFARVGLVSSLYTRLGFTDEIGRGKSSFMVEMSEVAEILAGADARSLVLLDEVGRGTSTFDGLALAWATLRYLEEKVRCRTILATHYHQLTELVESLPGARNAHLAVREEGGAIVFLHRLVPGSTDRSYGVHVARLAGLPEPLLEDAEKLLKKLEAEGPAPTARGRRRAGPRYTQAVLLEGSPAGPSVLERELAALDPERLTPLEALKWIHEARRRRSGEPPSGGP
jgi:DNA mismatch repair protein MutS